MRLYAYLEGVLDRFLLLRPIPVPSRLNFQGVVFSRAIGWLYRRLPIGQLPHVKNVPAWFLTATTCFDTTFRIECEPESVWFLIEVVVFVGAQDLHAAMVEEQFRWLADETTPQKSPPTADSLWTGLNRLNPGLFQGLIQPCFMHSDDGTRQGCVWPDRGLQV